jgi:hypothetical protein
MGRPTGAAPVRRSSQDRMLLLHHGLRLKLVGWVGRLRFAWDIRFTGGSRSLRDYQPRFENGFARLAVSGGQKRGRRSADQVEDGATVCTGVRSGAERKRRGCESCAPAPHNDKKNKHHCAKAHPLESFMAVFRCFRRISREQQRDAPLQKPLVWKFPGRLIGQYRSVS